MWPEGLEHPRKDTISNRLLTIVNVNIFLQNDDDRKNAEFSCQTNIWIFSEGQPHGTSKDAKIIL